MSTSMLTSWVREWGGRLQQPGEAATAAPECHHAPRRSQVVADIDIEKTVEEMRLVVLEKEVHLLREENDLIKRLLDQMLAKRP